MRKLFTLFFLALCTVMVMAQQPTPAPTPTPTPTPETKALTADEFQQVVDADRVLTLRQTELQAAQARLEAAQAKWDKLIAQLKLAKDCKDCVIAQDGKALVRPPAPEKK